MPELRIPNTLLEDIFYKAEQALPNEVCGYLAGVEGLVSVVYPMTNVEVSSNSFSMAPQEQIALSKSIREKGVSLLAVYHSHPTTPPRLSAADLEWANDDQMGYMIVSLQGSPEAKVYFIRKPSDNSVEIEQGLLTLL